MAAWRAGTPIELPLVTMNEVTETVRVMRHFLDLDQFRGLKGDVEKGSSGVVGSEGEKIDSSAFSKSPFMVSVSDEETSAGVHRDL